MRQALLIEKADPLSEQVCEKVLNSSSQPYKMRCNLKMSRKELTTNARYLFFWSRKKIFIIQFQEDSPSAFDMNEETITTIEKVRIIIIGPAISLYHD